SVWHVDERIGNGDGHALAVRFVAEVILGRPPDTGAEPFIGGDDPFATETVESPDEAAVPGRPRCHGRFSVIVNRDGFPTTRLLRRDERNQERVTVAARTQLEAILDDAVGDERLLQIDLHLTRRSDDAVGDGVVAGDAAVDRIYLDVEVVEARVPPRARGSVGAADGVGVSKSPRS